jgi:thiamine pyrophosphokinase
MDCIVVTGGDAPLPSVVERLPKAAVVIAADSGLGHARALGLHVDVLVGDLDSVTPADLAAAEAEGVEIQRHPAAKDATDLELALAVACDRGVERATVVGGAGGRFDHFLGNVLCLTSERFAPVTIDAWIGAAHVHVLRERIVLRGAPGSLVTLVPAGGAATGITTTGLRYPLDDETLTPGTTRGVSNEIGDGDATVTVRSGVLLVVQPEALDA